MVCSKTHLFIAVSPLDYERTASFLRFAACQIRNCVDIPINDDCIVEHSGEIFHVHLLRMRSLDHRILLSPEPAIINITDDNGRNCELRYLSL